MTLRVGLIGYGAIGQSVARALLGDAVPGAILVGISMRPAQAVQARAELPHSVAVVDTVGALLASRLDVVVEAAGHNAVMEAGIAVLDRGLDLYVLSTGILANDGKCAELRAAAERGGGAIIVPAGAVAGIDGLLSLRASGLKTVKYVSVKPPEAWRGTPAEAAHDLARVSAPLTLFAGSAREAALQFPKNANLAATVAFAGLGLDRTEVRLIADPSSRGNSGTIYADAEDGQMVVTLSGRGADDNPKTSAITAYSVIAALRNRQAAIRFG